MRGRRAHSCVAVPNGMLHVHCEIAPIFSFLHFWGELQPDELWHPRAFKSDDDIVCCSSRHWLDPAVRLNRLTGVGTEALDLELHWSTQLAARRRSFLEFAQWTWCAMFSVGETIEHSNVTLDQWLGEGTWYASPLKLEGQVREEANPGPLWPCVYAAAVLLLLKQQTAPEIIGKRRVRSLGLVAGG